MIPRVCLSSLVVIFHHFCLSMAGATISLFSLTNQWGRARTREFHQQEDGREDQLSKTLLNIWLLNVGVAVDLVTSRDYYRGDGIVYAEWTHIYRRNSCWCVHFWGVSKGLIIWINYKSWSYQFNKSNERFKFIIPFNFWSELGLSKDLVKSDKK